MNTAELSAEAPKSWRMTGVADGQGRFRLRPGSGGKGPDMDADAQLEAPELTVRGVSATALGITLTMPQ